MAVPQLRSSNNPSPPATPSTTSWKNAQLVCTIPSGADELALSSDRETLAGITQNGVVVWSISTCTQLQIVEAQPTEIQSITFSPDGQLIAGRTLNLERNTLTIKLWQTATGPLVKTMTTALDARDPAQYVSIPDMARITFSPDGQTLASLDGKGNILLWDISTGRVRQTFRGNSLPVRSITFSPDSQTLAIGTENGIKLWTLKTGQLLRTLRTDAQIMQVAFSPDGETLLSVSGSIPDKILQLWNPKTGQALRQVGVFDWRSRVVVSPDLQAAASTTTMGPYQVLDLTTGERSVISNDLGDKGFAIAFSPDGQLLAFNLGYIDGSVQVWRK